MFLKLNVVVNLVTLVMICWNWRDYTRLPRRDQFIWRYIALSAFFSFTLVQYRAFFGYSHELHQLYQKQAPLTILLLWFWDRLPGRKGLYALGILAASCALQTWANGLATRMVGALIMGTMSTIIGAGAVWSGRLLWRDLLQFGIGIILAHECFVPFIDRMPFAWDRWFAQAWNSYVFYLSALMFLFMLHYFVGRKAKPAP